MSELLRVEALFVHYGVIPALRDVHFEVRKREIVTLLGANGAGKSTTLRAISGLVQPSRGQVSLKGFKISGLPPHTIVQKRLGHVPEGRGIFANLTTEENLALGAWSAPSGAKTQEDRDRVYQLFPRLKERRKQSAGTLSGGEQQMLAIGRALMSRPELLLLDEPSLGLAPQMIEKIFHTLQEINQREGTAILLVEQNALQALQIAHRGVVLETGKVVLQGASSELLASDAVKQAYLGGG